MAKHNQRLDYARLAEVLHERGMAEVDVLREFLQQSQSGGTPFAEALVQSNLVSDWDLSRLVCEIFNLPFLTVDMLDISADIAHGLDHATLRQTGLVPIGRFGQVLTICMPGLVPADVLATLAVESNHVILPVVGTVETNRRWLEEHLTEVPVAVPEFEDEPQAIEIVSDPSDFTPPEAEIPELGGAEPVVPIAASESEAGEGGDPGAWSEMFDDADDAVMTELVSENPELEEASALEFHVSGVEDMDLDILPSITDFASDIAPDLDQPEAATVDLDLPPAPDFG